jgi:hypothetical protein
MIPAGSANVTSTRPKIQLGSLHILWKNDAHHQKKPRNRVRAGDNDD